jgi:hypothetical protein
MMKNLHKGFFCKCYDPQAKREELGLTAHHDSKTPVQTNKYLMKSQGHKHRTSAREAVR